MHRILQSHVLKIGYSVVQFLMNNVYIAGNNPTVGCSSLRRLLKADKRKNFFFFITIVNYKCQGILVGMPDVKGLLFFKTESMCLYKEEKFIYEEDLTQNYFSSLLVSDEVKPFNALSENRLLLHD